MTYFLDMVVAGLCVGSIYALVAVGFTVVFNATRVFNLAQGNLVTVAVMGCYVLVNVAGMTEWLALPLVIVGVILVSLFEELTVVRPFLRKEGNFGWFIATLAFSLILGALLVQLYGNRPTELIPSPLSPHGQSIGPVTVVPRNLALVVGLVIVVVCLESFYLRTRWGKAMRASAQDRLAAALRGIDPRRVSIYAFALGGLVAAVTGILIAPISGSDPTSGLTYTLKGFVVLAVGGFGSMRGSVVGGLVLGVAEQAIDLYWDPGYEILAGISVLLVVLLIRPQGLFGARLARAV